MQLVEFGKTTDLVKLQAKHGASLGPYLVGTLAAILIWAGYGSGEEPADRDVPEHMRLLARIANQIDQGSRWLAADMRRLGQAMDAWAQEMEQRPAGHDPAPSPLEGATAKDVVQSRAMVLQAKVDFRELAGACFPGETLFERLALSSLFAHLEKEPNKPFAKS